MVVVLVVMAIGVLVSSLLLRAMWIALTWLLVASGVRRRAGICRVVLMCVDRLCGMSIRTLLVVISEIVLAVFPYSGRAVILVFPVQSRWDLKRPSLQCSSVLSRLVCVCLSLAFTMMSTTCALLCPVDVVR